MLPQENTRRGSTRGGRWQRDAVNLWEEVARDREEWSRRLRWRIRCNPLEQGCALGCSAQELSGARCFKGCCPLIAASVGGRKCSLHRPCPTGQPTPKYFRVNRRLQKSSGCPRNRENHGSKVQMPVHPGGACE
jgi:hypothetical protein